MTVNQTQQQLEELAEVDLDIPLEIICRSKLEENKNLTGMQRLCRSGNYCLYCQHDPCPYQVRGD